MANLTDAGAGGLPTLTHIMRGLTPQTDAQKYGTNTVGSSFGTIPTGFPAPRTGGLVNTVGSPPPSMQGPANPLYPVINPFYTMADTAPSIGGTDPTPTTGTTPDYWSQLVNEPGYMQLQQNLSAQGIAAAQTRKQNTNQALAQFGEIPDLSSSIKGMGLDPNSPMYQTLFGDIDPSTADAAKQLTLGGLSTTAGLDRQHATDIQSLLDQMAAHGTVQSGGTGVGLGQADQAYSGNQYNARTSLINYLTGVQSAFNQQQQQAANQLQQGAADAVARLIAQNPALGTGNPPPPSTQPLNLAAGLG